jgi:hypothetical protein
MAPERHMGNRAQCNVLGSAVTAALCILCPEISRAADDYAAWTRSTDVTLNTAATGANVAGTVLNFPVLVRLTSANFPFSQAAGNGRDIRFAKTDGSHLAYEIERWDSAHAQAEIWVRVDTVRGNTAGQNLKMLWGNPAAGDSSKAASVFRASDGYVAAWHLNTSGTAARPNAVSGGNPAAPGNFDGDESRTGIIAGADSLDGNNDFLNLGDGYTEFTAGFTYSVWVYPTAVKKWAHVLDLGSGQGVDNIIVNRADTTNNLGFHNWNGTTNYTKEVANQWALNQWQYITVTLSGKNLRMYKNGAQILADTLGMGISGAYRNANFLGQSNWAADQYFQGKLDEPELAKAARSADWVKLAYQNQKASQSLVTVVKPTECTAVFSAPKDTSVAEGEMLSLTATVECAAGFAWSVVSGPSQRILDPEARTLVVRIPRVAGDTAVIYRISGQFGDSTRTRDVRVAIREAIPDPVFTLPGLADWNGKDSIAVKPAISNLAAIRASRDSVLHWEWTFTGPSVDTGWLADGVMLRKAGSEGKLQIGLCLDNGSTPVCKTANLNVSATAVPLRPSAGPAIRGQRNIPVTGVFRGRDAKGRAVSLPRPSIRPGAARPTP